MCIRDSPSGLLQGCGFGFYYVRNGVDTIPSSNGGFPVSYVNCKALHNKGAISLDTTNATLGGVNYSAGFFSVGGTSGSSPSVVVNPAQKQTYNGCEATDNVYGFFLKNAQNIAIRECRADFNIDNVTFPGTAGEGFTDVGLTSNTEVQGTPALPFKSTSLFQGNTAFQNGLGTTLGVGTNRNYNIYYGAGQTNPVPLLSGSLSGGPASYVLNFVPPVGMTYQPFINLDFIQ